MEIKERRGGKRAGSGRSSLYKGIEKTKVHLYVLDCVLEYLDRQAEEEGLSRSEMINKILIERAGDKINVETLVYNKK